MGRRFRSPGAIGPQYRGQSTFEFFEIQWPLRVIARKCLVARKLIGKRVCRTDQDKRRTCTAPLSNLLTELSAADVWHVRGCDDESWVVKASKLKRYGSVTSFKYLKAELVQDGDKDSCLRLIGVRKNSDRTRVGLAFSPFKLIGSSEKLAVSKH